MAATPVGAATAIFLWECCRIYRRKVVLPVPAFPVRKICWSLWFTKDTAWAKAVFLVSSVSIVHVSYPLSGYPSQPAIGTNLCKPTAIHNAHCWIPPRLPARFRSQPALRHLHFRFFLPNIRG